MQTAGREIQRHCLSAAAWINLEICTAGPCPPPRPPTRPPAPCLQFEAIASIAADAENNVFVLDSALGRVSVFTEEGGFLTSFGTGGAGEGQLARPTGLDVSLFGEVGPGPAAPPLHALAPRGAVLGATARAVWFHVDAPQGRRRLRVARCVGCERPAGHRHRDCAQPRALRLCPWPEADSSVPLRVAPCWPWPWP